MWSGASKSYGFVEFEEQDEGKLQQLQQTLDWTELGSHMLHADWVDVGQQSWQQLHSRCLAVTGLPQDFTQIARLREMFSVVVSPVYCQVRIRLSVLCIVR